MTQIYSRNIITAPAFPKCFLLIVILIALFLRMQFLACRIPENWSERPSIPRVWWTLPFSIEALSFFNQFGREVTFPFSPHCMPQILNWKWIPPPSPAVRRHFYASVKLDRWIEGTRPEITIRRPQRCRWKKRWSKQCVDSRCFENDSSAHFSKCKGDFPR